MAAMWSRRVVLLLASLSAHPADAAEAPVSLLGDVPARAVAAAQDLGPLADTAPVTLTLALAPQQAPALASLIRDQYMPASPRFHQFLTPAQFAARFGATDAQLGAVTDWPGSQGLTVRSVPPNRLFVELTGSAVQVDRALGVRPHHYRGPDGTTFQAPPREPQIPSAWPVSCGP